MRCDISQSEAPGRVLDQRGCDGNSWGMRRVSWVVSSTQLMPFISFNAQRLSVRGRAVLRRNECDRFIAMDLGAKSHVRSGRISVPAETQRQSWVSNEIQISFLSQSDDFYHLIHWRCWCSNFMGSRDTDDQFPKKETDRQRNPLLSASLPKSRSAHKIESSVTKRPHSPEFCEALLSVPAPAHR